MNDWQDWGWGPHESTVGGPLRVRFDNWGGLIFAKPGNGGDYGAVRLRIKLAAKDVDFIGLRLESNGTKLPSVPLTTDYVKDVGDGWAEGIVPFEQLNPENLNTVDRVILHAIKQHGEEFVSIDKVELTKPIKLPPINYDASKLRNVRINVDCTVKTTRVHEQIFGFAYYPFNDEKAQAAQWSLNGTVRRWGGNTASTYNWEIETWNTGNDWYFENHGASDKVFFKENAEHGIPAALTIPMMGWVAKDTEAYSFPVAVFGPQNSADPYKKDAGNGKDKTGKVIKPGSPTRAYRPITPEYVKRWVETIRRRDAEIGKRSVWMYILDNEPMLWSTTHRDAHPEPLSYDELVQRTIDYGTAIREADPEAIIAGPAEWGWTNYLFSAKDQANGGLSLRPDRRAHDDLPVVAYYLKALAEHEKRTGNRILDVLDLHGYPYADGVCSPRTDPDTVARRLRSTRMLWDPSYVDESWVKEPVKLLPRMQEWVDQYYPGRGLSIGEWNFGAERHISGALATAEALGRYAQYGLTSAFYWTYPPANSPVMWAFRAYRNFDGQGAHFLDWFTPSTVDGQFNVSSFVSRDATGQKLVAVILNNSPNEALAANIALDSCGTVESAQAFTYDSRGAGITASPIQVSGKTTTQALPPYSISILNVALRDATGPNH